eukprot:11659618-Prorocentrum_lima.AAC.1
MKTGKCRFGEKCKFARITPPQSSSTSSPPTPPMSTSEKKKICPFHSKPGGRWYGDKCKLEHSEQGEKQQKSATPPP